MQNDDKERLQQPPIHTHLPDTVPPEDVKKIVGDAVPHGADYNLPPPAGAGKSMGSGLDDSVGGPTMGADPAPRGQAATTRDQDSRAVDQHMGNLQQGSQQLGGQQQGNQQQGNPQQGNQQQGNQQQGNPQQGNQQQGNQQQGNPQQGNQQQGNPQQGGQGSSAGGRSDSASGGSQSGSPGNTQRATEQGGARSEGLLPAGGEADGRFEVGEEVSFDQQSDQARKVGSMDETAKGPHGEKLSDAVAGTLGKDRDKT
ncbi:hypothetical protein [Pseudoduganella albidiflava]|uniref:Uncharacterized protein n=1 Tax=Pseudoduganella albidiflava TaxID=321983 RepID=A0A411X1I7_9BURK|nr:hypothetical protein [Pseudoduganella albidiflava]QBI02834.1 hypothetical protein EYF70_19780 [Pseudoduganella albidiflava]GGY56706.1 hypothetical protein GCM10007387_44060 [Pseudoduganella albidiflava]